MKKLFLRLVSLLGPLGTGAAVLAVVALSSLGLRGVVRSISRIFTPVVVEESGGNAVIRNFEAKFQYRPLVVFDAGIIVMPRKEDGEDFSDGKDLQTHLPARSFARMVAQYSGYAEYVVDIDISSSDVITNATGKIVSIRLNRPRCPIGNVRSTDATDPERLFIIDGTDDEWKAFYERHYAQFVTAAIHAKANTLENRKTAEEQTRFLVNAMIGDFAADPLNGVEIIWRE